MSSDPSPASLSETPLNSRAFGGEAAGCGCALCTGAAVVFDTEPVLPQSYTNADERALAYVNGKQSFSSDRAALQMTGFNPRTMEPYPGWGSVGQAYTVTYAFRADAPGEMPDDTTGFQRFNPAQIQAAELAMQGWSDAANITFQRVGFGTSGEEAYSNSAQILLANYTQGAVGASAFAFYPGGDEEDGDVWINIEAGTNAFPVVNNQGMQVLLHEIGHAIGLAHPGRYNVTLVDEDNDPKTPPTPKPITYAQDALYYEDSRQYTVMSYFSAVNTGASYGTTFPAAPQLDDIRAIQIEYGANMSTRTGDTTYGFNSNAERAWFMASNSSSRVVFAVWDAGGTDTFDFSRYSQNQTIDLREGFFSNVGDLIGNVAVAHGAKIENAIGGFGADTINGNALNNFIEGNAGSDRVFAGAGNDTIDGGSGSSYLRGDVGDDSIVGGSSFDDINGNMGADTAFGGIGDDWVVGGKDNDVLYGNEGSDLVYGNLGDDIGIGGEGNDTLRGGQGADSLMGDAGADYVSGDRGNDTMAGGAGADLFHSFTGADIDRIIDFNFAEGDRVLLDVGTTYTAAQVGADTVLTLGASTDQVILVGVQLSSLGDGWVIVG